MVDAHLLSLSTAFHARGQIREEDLARQFLLLRYGPRGVVDAVAGDQVERVQGYSQLVWKI